MDRIRIAFVLALVIIVLGVSASASAHIAFVVNLADGVSVIDTGANTVVAAVTVGTGPQGVAVTPDGAFAYVTNFSSNSVSVIDTKKATDPTVNPVVATVGVGVGPLGVAVTPNGAAAYVAVFGNLCRNGGVWVIDTATNMVVATVSIVGCISGVAITPDGAFAYVTNTNSNSNTVWVIDTGTNSVVQTKTVTVGSSPFGVALTPDGRFAYVTHRASSPDPAANTVSVIDIAANTVTAVVAVGVEPHGVAITPDGASAYVANSGSNDVSVINTATNTVAATVVVETGPQGVAITPDGAFAYVTNSDSNSVSVIDTSRRSVVTTVRAAGASPQGIAIAILDRLPPDTTILNGPTEGSVTNSAQATFTFSGSDDRTPSDALAFTCSLDDAASVACVSPQTYSGLAGGGHSFAVRAVDAAGNVDSTPATRAWTVDTTPPGTFLLSGPTEGAVTSNARAEFTFSGTDDQTAPSSLTFVCSVDGATGAVCSSPQAYSNLAEGPHTFAVQAVDIAGNADPTPAMRAWTVDSTPPSLSVKVSPQTLWPPNHQLVEVTVNVSAADNIGVASVVLSKVECVELDQGACPSDAIQGADIGTLDTSILLRSERTGGSSRIYTLTYQVTDLAGNTATGSVTVTVAKSP